MEQKYMVCTVNNISQPLDRQAAISRVKELERNGVDAYIVSKDEGERIKKSHDKLHTPRWS